MMVKIWKTDYQLYEGREHKFINLWRTKIGATTLENCWTLSAKVEDLHAL